MGYRLNRRRFGLSSPTSGRREMPWVEGTDVVRTVSDAGSKAAGHRDSRPAARACGAERHHCLLSLAENGGPWLLGSSLKILDRLALALLRDGLRVDPEFPPQRRGRSLRSLYCCSDGVRSRGAAVTSLSHNSSFHCDEWIAPSNRGIKHLATHRVFLRLHRQQCVSTSMLVVILTGS
jgi:hypothetical protein